MKTAVVFYSLSGNTKSIAKRIAKALEADIIEIRPEHAYPKAVWMRMAVCGAAATFGLKPPLKDIPDLSGYVNIVLGAPVWAGTVAAPMNTFVHNADLSGKSVALFATCAGGSVDKFMYRIKTALSQSHIVSESFYVFAMQQKDTMNTKADQADRAIDWAQNLPFA